METARISNGISLRVARSAQTIFGDCSEFPQRLPNAQLTTIWSITRVSLGIVRGISSVTALSILGASPEITGHCSKWVRELLGTS